MARTVIPFAEIQARAIPYVRTLVPRWIPNTAERGDWIISRVPWREDKRPSFGVSITTGHWQDFARGDKGDLIDLLRRIRGISMAEAARELSRTIGYQWEE